MSKLKLEPNIEHLESCAAMLGQIAVYVEDWCYDEETTTLQAVKNLLADYYDMKARELRDE